MPQTLAQSPADVIQQLLIDLGVASAPDEAAAWPVYSSNEPTSPDNCITVYDTLGKDAGRSMIDGELFGFAGFQVRVRSKDHETGWKKIDAIQTALAESVLNDVVQLVQEDASLRNYLVSAVSNIGRILVLGKDTSVSKRSLFTLNAIAYISEV